MKKFWILLVLTLMAHSALSDDVKRNVELRLSVDGMIEIDPEGRVHDYSIETDMAPAIRNHVDQRVRQWRFEPITVDGRAVIATTRMRMELLATPDGDQYRLLVDDVHFGIAKTDESTHRAPRYPEAALRARLGARVVLVLRTDAHGRVTDVHPYQTSLTQRRIQGRSVEGWRQLFEKAAMDAVANWTYEPDEHVDGEPVDSTRATSIEFRITGSRTKTSEPGWQAYVPGPVTRAPWQPEGMQGEDRLETLKDGEALAVASRFRLLDSVVGNAL
jgi:hypothetical protein